MSNTYVFSCNRRLQKLSCYSLCANSFRIHESYRLHESCRSHESCQYDTHMSSVDMAPIRVTSNTRESLACHTHVSSQLCRSQIGMALIRLWSLSYPTHWSEPQDRDCHQCATVVLCSPVHPVVGAQAYLFRM